MEIQQHRAGQVETHKARLKAWKSLAKGGSLLASEALQTIVHKRRKEANNELRKKTTALTRAQKQAGGRA